MISEFLIPRLRNVVLASSQSGWTKALYITVLTEEGGMTAADIAAAVDVPGFSTPVVQQHLDAVDLAIEAGVLPRRNSITTETEPPSDNFDAYYTGIGRDTRYTSIKGSDAIRALAEEAGVGATKALDIAKNPRALGIAFQGSGKAQQAILNALDKVPDALLQQLAIRAYAVMTDRADPNQRIQNAALRESMEHDKRPLPIRPDHAVVVNGSTFVLSNADEADRFLRTYQEVHGRPASLLLDTLVTRYDAWNSLREFREAQIGRVMSTEEWQEYITALV